MHERRRPPRRTPGTKDIVADASGRHLQSGLESLGKEARDLFRAAARAHDAERHPMLPDADADRVWRELWRGGWAVVDAVETDDKRMLLLHRDPSDANATALDAREQRALQQIARGATYKTVAFDLGVAVSTASGIVARALRTIGFGSRVDFVRHMGERRGRSPRPTAE